MYENGRLPMGDKLMIRGAAFHGYHGVLEKEKTTGQKFLVDVDAWVDMREAGETDSLSNTVSYSDIHRMVKEVVEGPSQDLIESVAQHIANMALNKYPRISAILVKIWKPDVAARYSADLLGIEILRHQSSNTSAS